MEGQDAAESTCSIRWPRQECNYQTPGEPSVEGEKGKLGIKNDCPTSGSGDSGWVVVSFTELHREGRREREGGLGKGKSQLGGHVDFEMLGHDRSQVSLAFRGQVRAGNTHWDTCLSMLLRGWVWKGSPEETE